jgi:hypothetical protein
VALNVTMDSAISQIIFLLQWKPLNNITLRQIQIDSKNRQRIISKLASKFTRYVLLPLFIFEFINLIMLIYLGFMYFHG